MSRIVRTAVLPLLGFALVLGACDDPVDVDPHPEAEGIRIVSAADETNVLYEYMLGDEVAPLSLAVGVHDVAIVFLDHDGNPLAHEREEGEEEEMQVTIGNTSILTWTPEPEDPTHVHDTLEFHGELQAHAAGSTTLQICLLHAGHCDFEVEGEGIPVTVTQ